MKVKEARNKRVDLVPVGFKKIHSVQHQEALFGILCKLMWIDEFEINLDQQQ